jgi:hypothetical protein
MFDALSRLYEGKNINRKMTLRTQLKGVKMKDSESIQSYFTRVSQLKEKIEAIGDSVEEVELVMTTMNGLPRPWDPFIKGFFEGSLQSSADYGKTVRKKKQGWKHVKRS